MRTDDKIRFSADFLKAATDACWHNGEPTELDGVYTDSRQPGEKQLFLALAGERFDAHDFLAAAIDNGAAALCIAGAKQAKLPAGCPIPVLTVADPLRAYQAIARAHRERFPQLKLAAVTGSVGKTSVKEMIRAILVEAAGEPHVLYTRGNTNNQIGVPQNLLRLTPEHRYAVIEMGTNHHGEIEPLSLTARPDAALVNSIAPCHLEFLGSLAGVAREKSRIFCGLDNGGCAVIPQECAANEVLTEAARPYRMLRFGGQPGADLQVRYHGGNLRGSAFTLTFPDQSSFRLEWQLTGAHQAVNAAAAAAVALALGIEPETIVAGLTRTQLPGMRGKITEWNDAVFVNDAYNANPGSMLAAFDWLAEFAEPQKLVLILGEMRELGEDADTRHAAILEEALSRFPGARVITIGAHYPAHADVRHYSSAAAAADEVRAVARPGTLLFAKGSRGIEVELALPEEAR